MKLLKIGFVYTVVSFIAQDLLIPILLSILKMKSIKFV